MDMATVEGLAYLTADQSPIPAHFKQRPEDFIVHELPLFEPADTGDHLYLFVQKHRRLTTDVARLLARHFGVSRDAIGFAGLKDKHAVTRQWFSIEHADEDAALAFQDEHIQVLELRRHHHKLRRGKLAGNRFQIRLRSVGPEKLIPITRTLDRLAASGAPNFIGEQRFGYRRDNHFLGRALLLDHLDEFLDRLLGNPLDTEPPLNRAARLAYEQRDYDRALDLWPTVHRFERQALGPLSRGASTEHAVNGIDKTHRTFLLSAFQSAIFNHVLNQRLRDDNFDKLQSGDVALIHANNRTFLVDQPEAEQPRCDRLEISPSGPMWGAKMQRAQHDVAELELEALHETGVAERHLPGCVQLLEGSRRPLRMPIRNHETRAGADEHGPYVELRFDLPRGSFATTVLREIIKTPLKES